MGKNRTDLRPERGFGWLNIPTNGCDLWGSTTRGMGLRGFRGERTRCGFRLDKLINGCLVIGTGLIERDRLSRRNRCFGMANLLKEIVHRLALRVDYGCPSIFEWLRGPLLVRGWLGRLANRGGRGRSQSIERRDEVKHGLIWLRGPLRLGLSRWHRTLNSLCRCSLRGDEFWLVIRTGVCMLR
jgi:hypothetical protein